MRPAEFRDRVFSIADAVGFPRDRLILGGDHLGPLTWSRESNETAMEKAEELVREFVLAGYKKIHLDTSMRLGDDPVDEPLKVSTIAERGARLFKVCEEAYQSLLENNPDEKRPSYVIGSEVPIPGGEQEPQDQIAVTKPADLHETITVYKEEFSRKGVGELFEAVVAIVVQPGVEFGDENLVRYNRVDTVALSRAIDSYPGMVLEGHSTDYQSPKQLKEMVEDGIAILKVGPALTFAAREGLFALSCIERELIPEDKRADYPATLDKAMRNDPKSWEPYYKGSDEEIELKRKYSFSDRCRYYTADPEVNESIERMFDNLDEIGRAHV